MPQSIAQSRSRFGGLSLSIGEKASLLLALAMLPFVVTTARAALHAQPAIDAVAEERAGLHYLHDIAHVRRALDISSYDLSDAMETLRQAEANYGAGLGTATLASEAITVLERASRDTSEASFAIDQLADHISRQSGLEFDAGADAGDLRRLALETSPAVAEEMRNLDALVGGVRGRASEMTRSSILRTIGALDAGLRPLDRWRPGGAGQASAELDAKVAEARRTVSLMSQGVLGDLRAGRLNAAAWSRQFRDADASLRALQGAARIALDRTLKSRGDALEAQRLGDLLIAALLLAATIAALLLALQRTLVQPMQKLQDATGALISGDYERDIPLQARGDEIGAIARFLETFRELAQSRMRAEIARQSAESASLAKSQFIANMSHELRTPLNAIIGYSEILLEEEAEKGESANARDLERILASARHLLGLINDILDLSKVEAGRMDLMVDEIDPRAIVEDVTAAVAPLIRKNASQLIVEIGEAPGSFKTDPLKLRQCLLNLLSNAAKFTKDGIVRLSVEGFQHEGESALRFMVADTGIGISRQQQQKLFQPFSQADETITREYGGTGLGLMLTKHLAHLLGGGIQVKSEKGAGSEFTLWIRECAAAGLSEAADDALNPDAPLIIVIDDEREAHDLTTQALRPLGFRVQGAPNAAIGLDLARAQANKTALIVLDINLPDRPGWSVLAALKADAATASLPVIVLSVDGDRQTSSSLGAAEHLVKPVAHDVLAATVLRLARNPTAAHEGSSAATAFTPRISAASRD